MSGAKGWHCPCGHDFDNNCAHRLSHAIGHVEVGLNAAPVSIKDQVKGYLGITGDVGHVFLSSNKDSAGAQYVCCSAGRFLRADQMLAWYVSRGYKKHSQPNKKGDSVVFSHEGPNGTGHHIYAINSSGQIIPPSIAGAGLKNIQGYWY